MNNLAHWIFRSRNLIILSSLIGLNTAVNAEDGLPQSGQPASDVLQSYDIWGNPTPVGGVTNGGTTSHSTW